jgi:flagellar biogenesis protein FliO
MSTGFWFNYALALVVVALMLGGLYIIVRGLARGRLLVSADRRLVTVLESTMLAQHVSVHVVKVGSQYLLIGGGQGHVNTLAQLTAEEVDAWLEQQRLAAGVNRSLLDALRLRKQ